VRFVNPNAILKGNANTLIIEVLDVLSESVFDLETINLDHLENHRMLMKPLLTLNPPIGEENSSFRFLDIGKLPKNYQVPNFCSCSNKSLSKPERFEWHSWHLIRSLTLEPWQKSNYAECRKYGLWQHISLQLVNTRITMEFLHQKEEDVFSIYKKDLRITQIRNMANQTVYFR